MRCGLSVSLVAGLCFPWGFAAAAERDEPQLTAREKMLLERIEKLEQRISALEAAQKPAAQAPSPVAPTVAPAAEEQGSTPASGTTFNVLLDGYYEYNFNRPAGRINVLRAYDPAANSFTVNQAAVVIERAANPVAGRRFGLRLDLMFGQATESLSGNPANEPRTAPYRNIFQAYGTYVFPLGKGLTVDLGRFASSLGFESRFAKDQIDYTRSLLFTALPFYHLGFRTSYKLNDSTSLTWLLVNGINQSEDFNGFKSNHVMLTKALSKSVSWSASYYVGQENRDVAPAALSNEPPALPTQPGLSTDRIDPRPNGRTHIADTYLTVDAMPKLTLVAEGDYIVSRVYSNSFPSHVAGGAGYVKYQFAPAFSLAGRFEYLSDRGGYFSGMTQALKEGTVTATWQPADGFQMRWEFRRDYSNRPFFLGHFPGAVRKDQNTAILGLLWWFGGKQGSW